jgi:hypothetical protein
MKVKEIIIAWLFLAGQKFGHQFANRLFSMVSSPGMHALQQALMLPYDRPKMTATTSGDYLLMNI